MKKQRNHVIKLIIGITLLTCFGNSARADSLSIPKQVWIFWHQPDQDTSINLSASKLSRFLDALEPQKIITGIVIPVLSGGRCFYQSEVEPFKGRDSNASSQEIAVLELLESAQAKGIPVFLHLDLLAWQNLNVPLDNGATNIFSTHPDWREISGGSALPQKPEALFASPFNPKVRQTLTSLVQEVSRKFPTCAGVIFDARLSDREILGFSEAARFASITDIGIDPIDLNLQNRADEANTKLVYQWMNWKREQMASLVKNLSEAYKQSNPKGQVLAIGLADYYQRQEFNDLRRTQDWRHWQQQGLIDGVLLGGHWQSSYNDTRAFADFLEETTVLAKERDKPLTFVPVSYGAHRDESSYARDWANLKIRVPSLDEMALIVGNDEDLQQVVVFLSGKAVLSRFEAPRLNERLPDFTLSDGAGNMWEERNSRGQSSTLLLVTGDKAPAFNDSISSSFDGWKRKGVQPVVATNQPFNVVGITTLKDNALELGSWFKTGAGYAVIDRAGFVRQLTSIESTASWDALSEKPFDPTPLLKDGLSAPDFTLRDMNNQIISLSDFKGKKHLLLTFFPRCFTGGCKQHLASLQASENELEKNDLAVVAVSVDPPDLQQAFAESLDARFRFIPDVGRNLCILYGATANTTDLAKRMSVLIDKNGVVRWIDSDVNIKVHGADVLAKMHELNLTSQPQ